MISVAEYIDREVLIKKLSRMIDYCRTDTKVNGLTALFQVGDAVIDCKTADVVAVVRCKDCLHHDYTDGLHWCYRFDSEIKPKGFCSYGKTNSLKTTS